MESTLELIILRQLITNEDYFRTVIPYLKDEYFSTKPSKEIYKYIHKYNASFDARPSNDVLKFLAEKSKLEDVDFKRMIEILNEVTVPDESVKLQWLVTETEKHCRDTEIYNIIYETSEYLQSDDEDVKGDVAERMADALGITFSIKLGHDYFRDAAQRYEDITSEDETMSTNLQMFDKVLRGGLRRKTLTVFQSSKSGGFKSGTMIHLAMNSVKQGRNVVYFTFELSETRVGERADANLLQVEINDIPTLPKEQYLERIMSKQGAGKFIIKEYPTGTAHVGHLRYFLKRLEQSNGFVPDEIYIDYVGIMESSRAAKGANSYEKIKLVCEECRALGMELEAAAITAAQSGRSGNNNLDMDSTDIAESYGIVYTADVIFGLIETDELRAGGLLLVKQIKNRFNDIGMNTTFPIAVNKAKMTLYDTETDTEIFHDVKSGADELKEMDRRARTNTGSELPSGMNL